MAVARVGSRIVTKNSFSLATKGKTSTFHASGLKDTGRMAGADPGQLTRKEPELVSTVAQIAETLVNGTPTLARQILRRW